LNREENRPAEKLVIVTFYLVLKVHIFLIVAFRVKRLTFYAIGYNVFFENKVNVNRNIIVGYKAQPNQFLAKMPYCEMNLTTTLDL